jgi:hypothetical protein
MTNIKLAKVKAFPTVKYDSLDPSTVQPNTVYLAKKGNNAVIAVSDQDGSASLATLSEAALVASTVKGSIYSIVDITAPPNGTIYIKLLMAGQARLYREVVYPAWLAK